jgi:hypothetical protein
MALIKASENGDTETVAMLLENGADVNATDKWGRTALLWASHYGYTEIVKMLLKEGADVDASDNNGDMALIGATVYGHTEIVKKLLEAGANANAQNRKSDSGETALSEARYFERTEIVELLEKQIRLDESPQSSAAKMPPPAAGGEEEQNICPICRDDENPMNNDNSIRTPCKHTFHKECLKEWCQTSNTTCPSCRTDISQTCSIGLGVQQSDDDWSDSGSDSSNGNLTVASDDSAGQRWLEERREWNRQHDADVGRRRQQGLPIHWMDQTYSERRLIAEQEEAEERRQRRLRQPGITQRSNETRRRRQEEEASREAAAREAAAQRQATAKEEREARIARRRKGGKRKTKKATRKSKRNTKKNKRK